MSIPRTRAELIDQIETEFQKLNAELQDLDAELANEICVDDWTIKDLLAVRLWWSTSVLNWIEQGRQGKHPVTPAKGYRWKETPLLNADIVNRSRKRSYKSIVTGLQKQYSRLLNTIDGLSDEQLLEIGAFAWAGGYPISRWLSINTVRQYHTARAYVRRVKRRMDGR